MSLTFPALVGEFFTTGSIREAYFQTKKSLSQHFSNWSLKSLWVCFSLNYWRYKNPWSRATSLQQLARNGSSTQDTHLHITMQKLYFVKVKSCLVIKTFTKILCVILIFFACTSPINTPPFAGRSWGKVSKWMGQTVLSVLSYLPPHTLNQSCSVCVLRRDTAMNKAVFLKLMVSQIFPETAMLQKSQGIPLSLALTCSLRAVSESCWQAISWEFSGGG